MTRHGWFEPAPDAVIDLLDLPQEAFTTTVFAAGNMTSSSADLLDWGEALYSGELLGPQATATMLEMRSPFTRDAATGDLVATDQPTRLNYGLGAEGFCLDTSGCDPERHDPVAVSKSVTDVPEQPRRLPVTRHEEEQAREACKRLTRRGVGCFPLAPHT